jgi:hypothetical protein
MEVRAARRRPIRGDAAADQAPHKRRFPDAGAPQDSNFGRSGMRQ